MSNCAICLEPPRALHVFNCGHGGCAVCVHRLLRGNHVVCHECRAPIETISPVWATTAGQTLTDEDRAASAALKEWRTSRAPQVSPLLNRAPWWNETTQSDPVVRIISERADLLRQWNEVHGIVQTVGRSVVFDYALPLSGRAVRALTGSDTISPRNLFPTEPLPTVPVHSRSRSERLTAFMYLFDHATGARRDLVKMARKLVRVGIFARCSADVYTDLRRLTFDSTRPFECIAIIIDARNIRHIEPLHIDETMCRHAIEGGVFLRDIPERLHTLFLCQLAARRDPENIRWVPDGVLTAEMIWRFHLTGRPFPLGWLVSNAMAVLIQGASDERILELLHKTPALIWHVHVTRRTRAMWSAVADHHIRRAR